MRKTTANMILHLLVLCILFAGINTYAADDEYALSRQSYEVLTEARELMQENAYTEAIRKIRTLLADEPELYDQAVAYQTLGYIYISMDDYPAAIDNFVRSLDGDHLPEDVSHHVRFTLAQLLIHQASYSEGLKYLEKWFEDETSPDKQAYLLAASAYYQIEAYDRMLPMVQKAMARTETPDHTLYELLLAGYFNTGQFGEAAATLEKMIKLFPDRDSYWLQLASTYYRLENYKKSLAYYEIALSKGILDQDRLLQLVRLYLNQSLPYKAGKLLREKMQAGVIEKNSDNLELLANSWLMAREYELAVDAFKQLASRKNDPRLYYRIGRISFEQENWEDAVNALDRALKNNLQENVAESHLLLGIAAYKLRNDSLSARALTEASGHDNTKAQARWWLKKLGERMEEQAGSS